jgi:hypothetical protein
MKDLTLTEQKPYQEGYYWMTEAGHDDEYYEDSRNFHMVEAIAFNDDYLWIYDRKNSSGYIQIFHNKLWAGPIPHPRKRDGN